MKFILIFLLFLFNFQLIKASSFSEMFGSEGAAGISNSKSRSLSYSMQYLAFSGVTGYVFKELYETGFFEPIGLIPDYYKNLSPLVYDKTKIFPETNYYLRKSKDQINLVNDLSFQKNIRISSFKSNNAKNLFNTENIKYIENQKRIPFNDFQIRNLRINNLIERYE
tara:strand:- start:16 stop:516 length:501 start_codon:yes stop_codon:yes gene_type:complete